MTDLSDMVVRVEADNTLGDNLKKLKQCWRVQESDGNWNSSSYMHGMFHGLELAMAIMENREPNYRDKPKAGYLDQTNPYPEQAPSVHKEYSSYEGTALRHPEGMPKSEKHPLPRNKDSVDNG